MSPKASPKAIDCLVNVHFGETEKQPEFMLKVRDDYFKGPASLYDQVELPQLLDEMDEHGVEKAILMDNLTKPSVTARKFVDERPDKFALAIGRRQPAAADAVAAGTERSRPRPAGGVHRRGAELLGRWPVPAERRRRTTRCTPSARNSGCRCASTPDCLGRRSPARRRTRSIWTASACDFPS